MQKLHITGPVDPAQLQQLAPHIKAITLELDDATPFKRLVDLSLSLGRWLRFHPTRPQDLALVERCRTPTQLERFKTAAANGATPEVLQLIKGGKVDE